MARSLPPLFIGLGYLLLFTIAIPWYWPEGDDRVWLGFPLWVVVTIAASLGLSIYTSWLFLKHWPTGEGDDE